MELTASGSVAVTAALSANRFEGNEARLGGGLHLTLASSTSVRLVDNDVSGNSAVALGGGMFLGHSGANPNATQQQIRQAENATAGAAAAAVLYTVPAAARITGGSWTENRAASGGGGAFILSHPELVVSSSGSAWSQNAALSGAGLYVDVTQGGRVSLTDVSLSDNMATYRGGGLYLLGSSQSGDGCGGQLTLDNVTLENNRGGLRGGGIAVATLTSVPVAGGGGNGTASLVLGGGGGANGLAVATAVGSSMGLANATAANATASVCDSPQPLLILSHSIVTGNRALTGGGIWQAPAVIMAIVNSTLSGNEATLSGGAIAALECGLLSVHASSFVGNAAGLSGGALFVDACRVVWLSQSDVLQNRALAGGGVHLTGLRGSAANDSAITGRGRSLLGSSIDAAEAPVALLSRVVLSGNSALDGDTVGAEASALAQLESSASAGGDAADVAAAAAADSALLREVQPYVAHGGGVLINGRVSVGMSKSLLTAQNWAKAGSIMASSQVCNPSSAAATAVLPRAGGLDGSSSSSLQQLKGLMEDSWMQATLALQRAAAGYCALLTISNSRLAGTYNDTAAGLDALPVAEATPPLWLRDSGASALRARCSFSSTMVMADVSASAGRRLTPATAGATSTAAAADSAAESSSIVDLAAAGASGSGGTIASRRSYNIANLETCLQEGPQADGGTARGSVLAVPAASMRIFSIAGATALVRLSNGTVRARGATGKNSPAAQFGPEEVVVALLVSPGETFDIGVQLMDETGQPVIIDVPAYSVSLTIQPNVSVKYGARPALTFHGVASWTEIELVGWPGAYSLRVDASVVSSSGGGSTAAASASLSQVEALELPLELLRCELGTEVEGPALDSDPAYFTTCHRCRQGQEAICAGAAIAVPKPGYWHSSMHSPAFHACPNSAACGANPDSNATTWEAAPAAVPSLSAVAESALASEMLIDFSFIASDARSAALALCQQWWAANFPPHRIEAVLARNGSLVPSVPPPCSVSDLDAAVAPGTLAQLLTAASAVTSPNSSEGTQAPAQPSVAVASYMQLQCAEGYTGQLCATCVPGYSLNTEYQCNECVSKAQTIVLGLITFLATVILISYTMFSNFQQSTADAIEAHEVSATDLIKVFITHVQYFIIITRLAIDYPPVIHKTQSVLSSLTGAENFVAYSPTCLFDGLNSAGQAAVSIIFGFATPIMAGVLAVSLWVIRYLVFNQRIMGRAGAFRGSSRDFGVGSFADCEFIDDDATHADSGAASEQAVAVEALHAPGGDTPEADGGSPSYFVAVMMGPTALEGGGRDAALVWPEPRPAAVGQVGLAETVAAGGGGGSGAAQGPRAVCEATITEHSPYGGATAGAARAASATGPDAAGGSLGVGNSTRYPQLPPPLPSRPLSPVTTPRACAPLRHHVPAFTNAAAYSGGTAGSTPRNPNAIRGGGPAYPAYPAYPAKASSHAAASIAGPTGHSGKSGTLGWSLSGQVARALSRLRSLRTRTGRSLSYADQALSLPQQMGVGLIVAAFILYPSLCQVSLSMFACYVIDGGNTDNLGSEYLTATWGLGYWTRNMNQQCYSGTHMRVYVPIGIVAICVFCLAPPAAFFAVTYTNRKRLDDLDVTAKYGFLYAEYRPEWCWWSAVMQLQTLSLVAVEVFGRAMSTLHQSLALLAVLIVNSGITMACSPVRHRLVMVCEFISFCVLSLTVTLSLYFLDSPPELSASSANAVGIIIVVVNVLALCGFIAIVFRFSGMKLVEKANDSAGMAKVKAWAASAAAAVGRGVCWRRQPHGGVLVGGLGGRGPGDKLDKL
eukprot:XP_001697277.1 polymorphic outer membrane protein [Chlamydomonas reinhardtii]